jgi:hypothetical protein
MTTTTSAPSDSFSTYDQPTGALPARLLAGPHTSSPQWLAADADIDLGLEINELSNSLNHLGSDRAFSVWTGAAIGAPLLRALLLDIAKELHLAGLRPFLASRQLWEMIEQPLGRYFTEDDVADAGRDVLTCLDLFDLVSSYGAGHRPNATPPVKAWALDREQVWTTVKMVRDNLVGFSTGVSEGKKAEAEVLEHYASLHG